MIRNCKAMRIIVGGESRKSGKTTAVCRIIAAFPDAGWTAVKISPHLHCDAGSAWSLTEDGTSGDTRRYLEAGARRALLYCGPVEYGLDSLLELLATAKNWIVETTSAAALLPHDLAILMAAPAGASAKSGLSDFPPHVRIHASDDALADLVHRHWKA